MIFLLDPACDLIEVGSDLIRGQYRFAGKALKIVEDIEAIRVIPRLAKALRDCDSKASAACIPGSKENLAMGSCPCSLIQVNSLFVSADRKGILARVGSLRINTSAKRQGSDDAILHSNKSAHGLLCVS